MPYDRSVKVIDSQFGPKFVHDPKRYRHHETNQIGPSDELVSFANGEQFMTVRMVINKFGGRLKIKTYLNPQAIA
jgi:hypothetical protein